LDMKQRRIDAVRAGTRHEADQAHGRAVCVQLADAGVRLCAS
jgi:hypothetical protein